MDLLPDEEQEAIATAAAAVLRDLGYPTRANDLAEAGTARDEELWKLAVQLGWIGLGVPSDRGGIGYGLPEQVVLVRELGRFLAIGPFVAGMVAAQIAGDETRAQILDGREVGYELGDHVDDRRLVMDGRDGLVLRVRSDDAVLLEQAELGVPIVGLDPTVDLVAATSTGTTVARGTRREADMATVLLAAALVGVCEAARDQSADHARTREQFGRAIGSFQAIKHTCADMAVRAEAAWRQCCWAALAVRDRHEDLVLQVEAAWRVASTAALENTAANIQVHGAMGFTAEHLAHLYLKRARTWTVALGTRR